MLGQEHAVLQYLHMLANGTMWQLLQLQTPFTKCIQSFVLYCSSWFPVGCAKILCHMNEQLQGT